MGNKPRILFVDDIRFPPSDQCLHSVIARTYAEAIHLLDNEQFDEVSLDHDIASFVGGKEKTGYDIALWLAERKNNGLYVPPIVRCHSANPVGRSNIEAVVSRYLQ